MICNGSLLKGTIKKYNHENSRSTQKLNKGALVWRLPALNHSSQCTVYFKQTTYLIYFRFITRI